MKIEEVAQIVHTANREVQKLTGEEVNPEWENAPSWMKESVISGIHGVYFGNSPEQSHKAWTETRIVDGWIWGEVKNMELKTHPCLVPYNELPPMQKIKDSLFVAIADVFEGLIE